MVKVPVRTPFELRQIEPVDEAGWLRLAAANTAELLPPAMPSPAAATAEAPRRRLREMVIDRE
jgi:hypothetical protein